MKRKCSEKEIENIKWFFFQTFFVRIKIVLQRYYIFKTFCTTVGSWLDTQGCRTRGGGQGNSVWAITPSQILADPLTLFQPRGGEEILFPTHYYSPPRIIQGGF